LPSWKAKGCFTEISPIRPGCSAVNSACDIVGVGGLVVHLHSVEAGGVA
jgi:hypothetical protein